MRSANSAYTEAECRARTKEKIGCADRQHTLFPRILSCKYYKWSYAHCDALPGRASLNLRKEVGRVREGEGNGQFEEPENAHAKMRICKNTSSLLETASAFKKMTHVASFRSLWVDCSVSWICQLSSGRIVQFRTESIRENSVQFASAVGEMEIG